MEEDFWSFSKRERIGIFGIAVLIILSLFAGHLLQPSGQLDASTELAFKEAVAAAIKQEQKTKEKKYSKEQTNFSKNKKNNKSKFKKESSPIAEVPRTIILKKFNPNIASKEDLLNLGFKPKTVNIIINFRNKGGKFFDAKGLKVIYGLDATIYEGLKDYVDIPKPAARKRVLPVKTTKKLDLNLCTAEELMELRGIGPTLSKRIIKYRETLRGYYAAHQLSEVYNLPDSTLLAITPFLIFSPITQKINLNDLEFPKIEVHPYLSRTTAAAIISLKDHEGKFKDWETIEKNIKITTEELENIKRYFDIY